MKLKTRTFIPEFKQLSIAIIGTAIGVGLTFFADKMVENNHRKAAQHETAIMAVCDINEIVQGLKDVVQIEESLFKVAMYVSAHQELIDSMSMDTLNLAFDYLYDNPMVVQPWTNDTKENAFNSGLDARMNIGNNQFYDNVQSCYYMRRSLMKVMADAPAFRRPVSKEDYEEFLQQLNPTDFEYENVSSDAQRRIMKQVFAQKSTKLYLQRYFSRRDTYLATIYGLNRLNRENKLLMDITDEDIETYIKKSAGNLTAAADLIIGTWEANVQDGTVTLVFHEDSTVERTNHGRLKVDFQLKEEDVFLLATTTIYVKGRWELRGDTLINEFDASTTDVTSFDLDLRNLPQSELEYLDSIELRKEEWKTYLQEQLRQGNSGMDVNERFNITFDKSGYTMVITSEKTTPTGIKKKESTQYSRKRE